MFRFRRRAAVLATASAVCGLLVLAGCSIENPQLPSYEVELIIPLGTIDESIGSLIENQEDFVIGEDGSISLSTWGELDALGVGDRLAVDVEGIDFSAQIGTIRLDPSAPVGFAYRLGELYPAAETVDGLDVPVPPFDFSLDSAPQDLPGFRSATLASGGLEIEVENGLPVTIGGTAPPEQLVILLQDHLNDSLLVDVVVPVAIGPGEHYLQVIDLAGRTLPDSVSVRLTGGSPGSGASTVRVDAGSELAVRVRTTELEVIAAEASFGAQSFEEFASVELPDSIRVLSATVQSGELVLRVRNDLPVPAQAEIEIPGFVDAQNAALVLEIPMPAGTTVERQVDLRPYELRLGVDPGQTLDIVARLSTAGSAGADVLVRSTDVVAVHVPSLRIEFSRVTGIVDPISIEIAESSTSIEIPEDLQHLQLQSAELVFGFRSTLGMPIAVDLQLEGTNDDGIMVPLETSFQLPAVFPDDSTDFSRRLDAGNSSIVEFLNNLPSTITFNGRAQLGDGFTIGTISVTDSVLARWSIHAPMSVAVGAQTIDSDSEKLDLGEELRRQIDERLLELTIEAEVTSTLPIAASAFVGIDADVENVFDAPALRLGPITIAAAGPVGSDGNRTPTVVTSRIVVMREDIPRITDPDSWQGLRVSILGTKGEYVSLRATDAVRVRGFLRARILMGKVQ